jgi:hypothetical protein
MRILSAVLTAFLFAFPGAATASTFYAEASAALDVQLLVIQTDGVDGSIEVKNSSNSGGRDKSAKISDAIASWSDSAGANGPLETGAELLGASTKSWASAAIEGWASARTWSVGRTTFTNLGSLGVTIVLGLNHLAEILEVQNGKGASSFASGRMTLEHEGMGTLFEKLFSGPQTPKGKDTDFFEVFSGSEYVSIFVAAGETETLVLRTRTDAAAIVPLPATAPLLLAAGGALILARRRRSIA